MSFTQGSVWTWPDPIRGDQGYGQGFRSRAADLWNEWGEQAADDEWWNSGWQKYSTFAAPTWQDDFGGQFNNSLYSFTTDPYDPWGKVTGYSPQSSFAYAKIMGDIGSWIEREHPELSDWGYSPGVGASSTANLGGDWAGVDKWNNEILQAQAKVQEATGVYVPGNVIKAIMKIESNGEFLPPNYAGYYGLMQVGPGSWGVGTDWDPALAQTDPAYNIFAGTMELARRYTDAMSQNPAYTWSNVAVGYFSGDYDIQPGGDRWTSIEEYYNLFSRYLSQLDAAVRTGSSAGVGGSGQGAQQIVDLARQYVGVPYILGGVSPQTGWDCSGFIWWLDQNYGTGTIPQGSHEQYAAAVNSGQLYTNTNQMATGDLLFFNTGASFRGNAASHVGMYIGNGQMIHAANPGQDTIISNVSDFASQFMGGQHASWSGGGAVGTSSFDAITGGIPFPISQEIGPTDWAMGEGSWMYDDYDYTLGIQGHPGLDVATPQDTQLFSPVSGTVVTAGGTNYFVDDRYGATPGTGELKILLDNGDEVILGHMGNISVQVGQRVNPGDAVGLSGIGGGGWHYHLEYRKLQQHQYGTHIALDPRQALSGNFSGQYGAGVGQGEGVFRAGVNNWQAFMRATATGQPVTGYTSGAAGGNFHNFMRSFATNSWNTTTGKNQWGANTIAGPWGNLGNFTQTITNLPKA